MTLSITSSRYVSILYKENKYIFIFLNFKFSPKVSIIHTIFRFLAYISVFVRMFDFATKVIFRRKRRLIILTRIIYFKDEYEVIIFFFSKFQQTFI